MLATTPYRIDETILECSSRVVASEYRLLGETDRRACRLPAHLQHEVNLQSGTNLLNEKSGCARGTTIQSQDGLATWGSYIDRTSTYMS